MRILLLEWLATAVLIVGTAVNSLGYYPQGPLLLCVGGAIWFAIAIEWRKASLIVVNGVMLLTGIGGLIVHYIG
jgi:hypothetical protein